MSKDVDWYLILTSDPQILGDIAVNAIEKGKPKKKKLPEWTNKPFSEAFLELRGDMSLNKMVKKLGLPKTTVRNFSLDTQKPTIEQMKITAKGFEKDPKYFREYRVALVSSALSEFLRDNPDISIELARKLKDEI